MRASGRNCRFAKPGGPFSGTRPSGGGCLFDSSASGSSSCSPANTLNVERPTLNVERRMERSPGPVRSSAFNVRSWVAVSGHAGFIRGWGPAPTAPRISESTTLATTIHRPPDGAFCNVASNNQWRGPQRAMDCRRSSRRWSAGRDVEGPPPESRLQPEAGATLQRAPPWLSLPTPARKRRDDFRWANLFPPAAVWGKARPTGGHDSCTTGALTCRRRTGCGRSTCGTSHSERH